MPFKSVQVNIGLKKGKPSVWDSRPAHLIGSEGVNQLGHEPAAFNALFSSVTNQEYDAAVGDQSASLKASVAKSDGTAAVGCEKRIGVTSGF